MAEEVILPSLGQTTNELTIIEWFKKAGDSIQKGDVLLEVETDKAVVPVEAFVEGILQDIRHHEGELVEVGSVLALILTAEEAANYGKAPTTTGNNGSAEKVQPAIVAAAESKPVPSAGSSIDKTNVNSAPSGAADDYIFASPLAKQMAREQSIDLQSITASGVDGIIKAKDVTAHVNQQTVKPTNQPVSKGVITKTKLSKMRKTIAERLTQSKQMIPHFYVTVHVNVSDLVRLREDFKHQMNVDISYNSFLFRASALALQKFPEVNASLIEDCILTHPDVHIGLAVEVEDGLRVPVIRNVGSKTVWELTSLLKETAERARQGRLTAAESSGGTFTISSLGGFGIDEFAAIINPPEAAILAVGRISKRPFVYSDEVKSGMGLSLTLSVDHRIVDGAAAGRFLQAIREELEHPHRLLVPADVQAVQVEN